jgi:hypothetical protein
MGFTPSPKKRRTVRPWDLCYELAHLCLDEFFAQATWCNVGDLKNLGDLGDLVMIIPSGKLT